MTVEEEDTHRNIIREGVGPRLHDRKFVFANRVVNKFCYLRFVLIVPSVLRHWWRR